MIDEFFLQNAVRIRRTYLKLSNNLNLYEGKTKETIKRLDETINEINKIQEKAKELRNSNKNGGVDILNDLLRILNDIENEGKSLENLIDPLNKEIEKLALEEQELYRQIKQKHNNLTDDEIINCVKDRLIKENL